MKIRASWLAGALASGVLSIGILAATAGHVAALPPPGLDACAAASDLVAASAPLPRIAEKLKPGGHLSVLAIGSATLFGPEASLQPGAIARQSAAGASAPIEGEANERAFPRQMAMMLEKQVPNMTVSVTVRGGRGMSAADMLELMRRNLAASKYDLVLWQTGTVEAVRNTPPGELAQTLSSGVEAVEQAGANLILIDPQYSRFLQTNSNLDPYVQVLQQAASMPGVLLFHRFDLMRGWANDGVIDLERTPKADRKRVGTALHACLGLQLARLVVAAAQP